MTLPFRNIRDVLGLHAKVSPHKNSLITYDENLQRKPMTYLEFVGKSHQVANFLFEDLDIKRGDTIAVMSPNHEHSLLLYFASWVIGASVLALDTSDNEDINQALDDNQVKVLFAYHDYLATCQQFAHSVEGIVQIGGEQGADFLRFEDLASNRPTTFLGDESGAKGADIPMTGGNEHTARLSDIALITYENGETIRRTQGDLLQNATRLAGASAMTGNQNSLAILPLHRNFVEAILTPLVVGATVILSETFSADLFWQLIVGEHIHTTVLRGSELQTLVDTARNSLTSGGMRFGGKIIQQDIKHFRHILNTDAQLTSQLACEFEDTFGLPLITAYQHPKTQTLLTRLPITLAWTEHQAWLHGHETPCIGAELIPNLLTIVDESDNQLDENQFGEMAIFQGNGWQKIGQRGYFKYSANGEKFYFIEDE